MNGAEEDGGIPLLPSVLVFAGVDPSGGAGIAADLQAIAAQGAHALTVVTALTAQDNDRVYAVQPVEPEMVRRQALALTEKIAICAVKIGITGSADNARVIAELVVQLRRAQPGLPVVLDTVLASGHGDMLSRDDAVQALAPLLPLATLITPNGPEAAALAEGATAGRADGDLLDIARAQAEALLKRGCGNVLITGGHGDGDDVLNCWFGAGGSEQVWRWPRLPGGFHGSGCTLASAIAGLLAQDMPLARALAKAQHYCNHSLRSAYAIAAGQYIPRR